MTVTILPFRLMVTSRRISSLMVSSLGVRW